jgi:hypothetical protein
MFEIERKKSSLGRVYSWCQDEKENLMQVSWIDENNNNDNNKMKVIQSTHWLDKLTCSRKKERNYNLIIAYQTQWPSVYALKNQIIYYSS